MESFPESFLIMNNMISIIVSTYKPDLFSAFTENVAKNIGIEYEIITIENKGLMGLCEAYNKGIAQAKYQYICFSHDDIRINTQNWGQYIIETFNADKQLGMLGVAGGGYKPWMPSAWFFSGDQRFRRLNLTQTNLLTNESIKRIDNPNKLDGGLDEVVTLDGCWFCTNKEIVDTYKFDSETFKGYHCYDIDYSLQVGQKYKLAVSFDLDIEHFSYGVFSSEWFIETMKLYKKWKNILPRSCDDPGKEEICLCEYHAYCFNLSTAVKFSVSRKPLWGILLSVKALTLIGLPKWIQLLKITIVSYLNKSK